MKYDYARREILPFVPAEARTILEVGCGSGRFGAELKNRNPGAVLWAIEPEAGNCTAAARHFDHVLPGFFPEGGDDLPEAHFDVIVFNDVLEHLVEPLRALQAAHRLLTPNGVVVASVPNVWHVSVGGDSCSGASGPTPKPEFWTGPTSAFSRVAASPRCSLRRATGRRCAG